MKSLVPFFRPHIFCSFMVISLMSGRASVLKSCHGWLTISTIPHYARCRSSTSTTTFPVSQRRQVCNPPRMSSNILGENDRAGAVTTNTASPTSAKMINLHTIPVEDLESILQSWGQPKYRAQQISNWVRLQGVASIDEMNNIPKKLKEQLKEHATLGALQLDTELISKDGTIKRAYRLADGQLIESVLMPYEDGRYTACISSQAGCAQGCVFCATGQMGFSRQLTPDEILEQVSRFSSELAALDKQERKEGDGAVAVEQKGSSGKKGSSAKGHGRSTRLSNIVFMGMGEPLANYRNVKTAIQRIHDELGIGHRKITVSTVGIVPNIAKMATELPQVRLAVSLHCASDEERTALLPANRRNGGLDELMSSLKNYMQTTGKRITLEWALIEGENDTPETAHQLGKLIHKWLRKDMVHVNVIPLNPTGGFGGSPSGRKRVNDFCQVLEDRYSVTCTPRVRRGIDINAGCGQLKSEIEKRERESQRQTSAMTMAATVLDTADSDDPTSFSITWDDEKVDPTLQVLDYQLTDTTSTIFMDDGAEWEDYEYETDEELSEADRLIALVKGTTITSETAVVGRSSAKATSA